MADQPGVNLLDTDDLELVDEIAVGKSRIPPAVKQAIIIEMASQTPVKLIAIRYDCAESTVRKIWAEFCAQASKVRRIADETPEETKSWLRGKALVAIENGLDCDRDPYRQAAVGINVMKGIGEFKSDHSEGTRINVLVNAVPESWKTRYIGAGPATPSKELDK